MVKIAAKRDRRQSPQCGRGVTSRQAQEQGIPFHSVSFGEPIGRELHD
jgi:hypothetical protein